jgi:hypothetical protein
MSGQGLQQRRGIDEVRRREASRARVEDGRKRGAGLAAASLLLPESGEAHRRAQLPGPALLAAGRLGRRPEATLGSGLVIGFGQVQQAFEAVQLGLLKAAVVLLRDGQTLIQ